MDLGIALSLMGTLVSVGFGVVGLVYARMKSREKADLENLVQANLQRTAGNIDWIRESTSWGHGHLEAIHETALKLDRDEHVEEILRRANLGKADVLAAERMVWNLLNEVLSIQKGLFGPEKYVRPLIPPNTAKEDEKD